MVGKNRTMAEALAERKQRRKKEDYLYGERTIEEAMEQNRLRRLHQKIEGNPLSNGKPVILEYLGKKQNLSAWARELGISAYNIGYRLRRGYPIEVVLRPGRITRSDHPESIKYRRQETVECAHEAICSLTELWERPMTTREILKLIEQKRELWGRKGLNYYAQIRALNGRSNLWLSSLSLAWVLRKVSCLRNKPMTVVKVSDSCWQCEGGSAKV